jgi:hypothetical protein
VLLCGCVAAWLCGCYLLVAVNWSQVLTCLSSQAALLKEGILRLLAGWKLPDGKPRRCIWHLAFSCWTWPWADLGTWGGWGGGGGVGGGHMCDTGRYRASSLLKRMHS